MVEDLGMSETEDALRLLLHVMEPEARTRLMATLPLSYARLFPTVDTQVVLQAVERQIDAQRDGGERTWERATRERVFGETT